MSLARWLADGADPAQMSPEEVRRLQNALGVREEQAIARLVARGAATPSPALRRALARRHGRLSEDVYDSDRELARLGKELAGLRAIRELLRDGTPIAAPGDCAPLMALLNDADASEDNFSTQLGQALRAGQTPRPAATGRRLGPDLMQIWEKMDRGEISSAREALRSESRGDGRSGRSEGASEG